MNDSDLDSICDRFDASWQQGKPTRLEKLLAEVDPGVYEDLLRALLEIEFEYRLRRGEHPGVGDYTQRFPQQQSLVAEALSAAQRRVSPSAEDLSATDAASDGAGNDASESPRQVIGPYKLLQQIGEGGMGTVYMAEQTKPVRRRVALKVVKSGLDRKEILSRFGAERQALAMMDHPNIAKVLDAGSTDDGRPYFVMELVHGIPITEYCDKNKLSLHERLQLFVQACRAIQHAHQKGIIHRDVKPSNVLVTQHDGVPVAKVIDFGLAKALQNSQRLTDKTMFTEFGQVVGTLQYMSPEQSEMNTLDIDTRSDVYSLGVLLYELLTGTTPIEKEALRKMALDRALVAIREEEAPRPSIRLSSLGDSASTISLHRKTDPRRLGLLLKGDLDWIAIKALEKDRNRRYESPHDLADDVSRFLNNDPVEARSPSVAYRVQKLVRKHRRAAAFTLSLLALLLFGLTSTTTFWLKSKANAQGWAKAAADAQAGWEEAALRARQEEAEATKARAAEAAEKKAREEADKARAEALKEANNAKLAKKETEEALALAKRLAADAKQQRDSAMQALEQARQAENKTSRLLESAKCDSARLQAESGAYAEALETLQSIPPIHRDFYWRLLCASVQENCFTAYGHSDSVRCLAVSPDGKTVLSGGKAEAIIWNARTGNMIRAHDTQSQIVGVSYSSDGTKYATRLMHGGLVVWDSDSGQELARLPARIGVAGPASDVLFLPNSDAIAFTNGNEVSITDCDHGKDFANFKMSMPLQIAISKRYLFSGAGPRPALAPGYKMPADQELEYNTAVKVWDLDTGAIKYRVMHDDAKQLYTVDEMVVDSADRALILSAGRLFEVTFDSKRPAVQRALAETSNISSLDISPDEQHLALGLASGKILLVDASKYSVLNELNGHSAGVNTVRFRPDNNGIVSGSEDGSVKFWLTEPVPSFRTIKTPGRLTAIATVKSPHLGFITADAHGNLSRWNTSGKSMWTSQCELSHGTRISVSGTQGRIAVTTDGKVLLWELESGKFCRSLTGNIGWVVNAEFVGESEQIIGGCYDHDTETVSLVVWNALSGKIVHQSQIRAKGLLDLDVDSEGAKVATAHYGGVTIVHSTTDLSELAKLQSSDSINNVAASATGDLFAISTDSEIAIWDYRTEKPVKSLKAKDVSALAFSDSQRYLVTVDKVGMLDLWNLESGRRIQRYRNHNAMVKAVDVAFNDSLLVSADASGEVVLRFAAPLSEPFILRGHTCDVESVLFGPRGSVATTTAKYERWDPTAGRFREVLNEEFIWNLQTGGQAGSLDDLELSPSETKDAPIRMIGIKRGNDVAVISEDPSALSMLRRQFGQSLFNQ